MGKKPKRGAPKKEGTRPIRMRVSGNLYAYLGLLKHETMLGKSENDVAERLLTDKLCELLDQKYHETGKLPEAAKNGEGSETKTG